MKTSGMRRTRQRRQLDARFEEQAGRIPPPPRAGWLRAIREGLGLSADQLAKRMGVTKRAVLALEERERKGTATFETVRRTARAMSCDLVYAVVPAVPLEVIVDEQARRAARKRLERVQHTMTLEAQEPDVRARARAIDEFAKELKERMPPELWDP